MCCGAPDTPRPAVSLSETFADGIALLRAADEHRLEGVVSKRRDAPFDRVTVVTGARSRRWPGARPIASGGVCLRRLGGSQKEKMSAPAAGGAC
jgi:hypothetical protein